MVQAFVWILVCVVACSTRITLGATKDALIGVEARDSQWEETKYGHDSDGPTTTIPSAQPSTSPSEEWAWIPTNDDAEWVHGAVDSSSPPGDQVLLDRTARIILWAASCSLGLLLLFVVFWETKRCIRTCRDRWKRHAALSFYMNDNNDDNNNNNNDCDTVPSCELD